MARARDPNRDKAYEIFKQHDGKILLKDIAAQLGKSDSQIRNWKKFDNWKGKLNSDVINQNNSDVTIEKKQKKTNKKANELEGKLEEENTDITDKQWLFVSFYIKYWNATKAYQKAYGCSREVALVNGSRLLGNARIKSEIIRLRDELTNEALLDKRILLQKWIDIAFADITDFLEFGTEEITDTDENGNEVKFKMNKVNLIDSTEIDGTLITEVKKGKDGITIKLADKMKALEYLSKHMDLLNENELKQLKIEQTKLEISKLNEVEEEKPIEILIKRKESRD